MLSLIDCFIVVVGLCLLPFVLDTVHLLLPLPRFVHALTSKVLVILLSFSFVFSVYFYFGKYFPFLAELFELSERIELLHHTIFLWVYSSVVYSYYRVVFHKHTETVAAPVAAVKECKICGQTKLAHTHHCRHCGVCVHFMVTLLSMVDFW